MELAIGIDVSKATLAVIRIAADGKLKSKSCPNTSAGHAQLLAWLAQQGPAPLAIGLEATGGYHDAVALVLHDAGHRVSVLNPAAVAAYAQSQLARTKTDQTDAARIAHYVQTQAPPAWTPPPVERRCSCRLLQHRGHTGERDRLCAPASGTGCAVGRGTWARHGHK